MELTGADLPMREYAIAKMALKSHWLAWSAWPASDCGCLGVLRCLCVVFALARRRYWPTDTLSPARNRTEGTQIWLKDVRRLTSATDFLTAALMDRLERTNSIRCAAVWNLLRCRRQPALGTAAKGCNDACRVDFLILGVRV